MDVKDHASYSGATERTSFNEYNSINGFLIVDLEKNDKQYHEISTRPMYKLPPIDCSELTVTEIYTELEKLSSNSLNEALVSLALINLRNETFIKLDMRKIDEMFSQVFYLEKQFVQKTTAGELVSNKTIIDSLPVEFERYIGKQKLKDLDAGRLVKLGVEYLSG